MTCNQKSLENFSLLYKFIFILLKNVIISNFVVNNEEKYLLLEYFLKFSYILSGNLNWSNLFSIRLNNVFLIGVNNY